MNGPTIDAAAGRLASYALRPRPTLEQRARAILETRDLYILAPAGYGKTGLLARMASAQSGVHVWNSQSESFTTDRIAAASLLIADIAPDADRKSLAQLRNWLEQPGRTTPVLLAARADPGLNLARLVANKRGEIWRTGEILCSLEDLRTVVLPEAQQGVDANRLNELHRRCDGWMAGAVLLNSERYGTSLPQSLPQSVREYYGDILYTANLPIDRDLLSLSALPDQISPKLFQHITGSSDFFALIEQGIDLQPVLNAPGWWRFGRLFSVYLRERALALGQSVLSSAHRRISDWHLNEGAMTEAALHALQSGDQALAMNVVDKAARRFIALGQITHARSWLTQLEPYGRETYPRIWLHLITAHIVSGEFDTAETELGELDAFLTRARTRHEGEDWFDEIVLHARFNRHMLAHMHPERCCDLADLDALLRAPRSGDFAVLGEALFLMGVARLHIGDDSGYDALEASLKALPDTQSWYAYAVAQRHLALRDLERGRFDACRQRCEHGTAQIVESTCFAPPCLAPITLVLGELALIEGNIETAQRILSNESMPLQILANEDLLAECDRLTGDLHLLAGAPADATHMLRQALSRRTSTLGLGTRRKAETALIRTLCQMHQCTEARQMLGERYGLAGPAGTPQTPQQRETVENVVRSAILMSASGEPKRARGQFSRVLPLLERREEVIEGLRLSRDLMECAFEDDTGQSRKRSIRDWTNQVEQAGAAGLLREARVGPFGHLYADGPETSPITSALHIVQSGHAVPVQMTPKEQETLEYMAIGYTNRQIADQTMTSLTTVKWHVRNILAKLEAQNRAAAINTARRLGLLL